MIILEMLPVLVPALGCMSVVFCTSHCCLLRSYRNLERRLRELENRPPPQPLPQPVYMPPPVAPLVVQRQQAPGVYPPAYYTFAPAHAPPPPSAPPTLRLA
jgi:hypothetical protein